MGMMTLIEGLEFYTSATPEAFECGGHMVMPLFTSNERAAHFGQFYELPSRAVPIRPQEIGGVILDNVGAVDFFALNPVGPHPDQVEKLSAQQLIWELIYEAHDEGRQRERKLAPVAA